jgi:hypothetical protein
LEKINSFLKFIYGHLSINIKQSFPTFHSIFVKAIRNKQKEHFQVPTLETFIENRKDDG